ncbi:MAG: SurA N-terminal domain-containing protein [Candidatus Omnitrophota bacterium]
MLLKFLRKRKNMKRIVWALAILIIPAFILWGAGTAGKKKRKGPGYAGKIFDRKVPLDEYLDMWRVSKDYLTRSFGANIPVEFIDQMTWNRILLLEASERENIDVKDSEIVERISSLPLFQRDGVFDNKLYKSMVRDAARGFEERLRDDMRISKLREKITAGVYIAEEEVKEEYKKAFEKIKASYISIPFSDFKKDVRYQESDLTRFYGENKETFRIPEEINLEYIGILFSDFDKEVYIEEKAIKDYFEKHLSDFKDPDQEERPLLDEETKKEISEKLGGEKKRPLAEELAYNALDKALLKKDLDEVSRSFGLEVKETGFFSMQQGIPGIGLSYELTKRGFELNAGEISNLLIKTEKGFYIIRSKEKKESYLPEFAEVKESVMNSYLKNESIKLAEKKAKKLYLTITTKIKNGAGFEDIASDIQKALKKTDLITRGGYIPALGPATALVEACTSLKIGETTGPLKMPESWVILRFDEYVAIDELKFIEEKEEFKEGLLSREKQTVFDEWFEILKKEADFVSHTLK